MDRLVEEAFQVGFNDGLDGAIKELVDKKETKTIGKGNERGCENRHTFNGFIIFENQHTFAHKQDDLSRLSLSYFV